MSDEASWENNVKRLVRAVEENLSAHPDAETLMARHRGELPASEADAVEEHLSWCSDCAALYRDLPWFLDGEALPADPGEMAEDWAALEERLASEPAREAQASPRPRSRTSRMRLISSLAAALLVVVGGAALWRYVANLHRPLPNVPDLVLSPLGTERGGEGPATIHLERGAHVVLGSRHDLGDRTFQATIVGEDGRTRWTIEGLRLTKYGGLTFELSPGSLPPGRYRIVVRGEGGGAPVESYVLRVVRPPAEPPGT